MFGSSGDLNSLDTLKYVSSVSSYEILKYKLNEIHARKQVHSKYSIALFHEENEKFTSDPLWYVSSVRSDVLRVANKGITNNDHYEVSKRIIHRVYVDKDGIGKYHRVGWILSCEVDNCMICGQYFGLFYSKHHCRACGNVICTSCSPEDAIISEIAMFGPVRVCNQCNYGQKEIFANPNNELGMECDFDTTHSEYRKVLKSKKYGSITLCEVFPMFVLKVRRIDMSVVYINICACTSIPNNLESVQKYQSQAKRNKSKIIINQNNNEIDIEARLHMLCNLHDSHPREGIFSFLIALNPEVIKLIEEEEEYHRFSIDENAMNSQIQVLHQGYSGTNLPMKTQVGQQIFQLLESLHLIHSKTIINSKYVDLPGNCYIYDSKTNETSSSEFYRRSASIINNLYSLTGSGNLNNNSKDYQNSPKNGNASPLPTTPINKSYVTANIPQILMAVPPKSFFKEKCYIFTQESDYENDMFLSNELFDPHDINNNEQNNNHNYRNKRLPKFIFQAHGSSYYAAHHSPNRPIIALPLPKHDMSNPENVRSYYDELPILRLKFPKMNTILSSNIMNNNHRKSIILHVPIHNNASFYSLNNHTTSVTINVVQHSSIDQIERIHYYDIPTIEGFKTNYIINNSNTHNNNSNNNNHNNNNNHASRHHSRGHHNNPIGHSISNDNNHSIIPHLLYFSASTSSLSDINQSSSSPDKTENNLINSNDYNQNQDVNAINYDINEDTIHL
eukprot:gene13630-18291_t